MGKKSRRLRRQKDPHLFVDEDDIMSLNINGEDKPRNAKQNAKLRKKLRKLKKKEEQRILPKESKVVGWHKIEVVGSEAMEKTFIYTSIGSSLELEFQPLGFHKIDNMCCFYLENNEPAASAMLSLSKRIQDSNGNLLKIRMMKTNTPNYALNSNQLQTLREVMSHRYQVDTSTLDLTNLHHDQVLLEKDILAPLSSPYVMKQVVRIIKDHIPDLKALNLSKNNLHGSNLCLLETMHSGSSQLQALNLQENAIGDMQELKHLKMFPLGELNLQSNPVVDKLKNKPHKYIELARKHFVHLKFLDGIDIEAYLAKSAESHGNTASSNIIQPSAMSSMPGTSSSAVSEPMVRSFLEQYYALIDAPDRSNLLAAYTPDAVLEFRSSLAAIVSSTFVGHDNVKKALATFPRTQHEHSTFSFNIQFPNPGAAQAVVMGQCQISGLDAAATFSRTLTIVPFNAGLCCSQDVLELR